MFFQLAAAGHATGANSHTLFWNQAEDKFKQVDGDLKGLPDLTTAKDEVTEIKPVLDVQVVWRKNNFKNDLIKVNISMTFIIAILLFSLRKRFYLLIKYMNTSHDKKENNRTQSPLQS